LRTVTAAPASYTLSLHDALPILATISPPPRAPSPLWAKVCPGSRQREKHSAATILFFIAVSICWMAENLPLVDLSVARRGERKVDRKSTRLNSSHVKISYAVFCL